ncbi:MAG: Gfo/Idh/MocA family oxidoreductase [Halieaceae bacterium]|nr:Gfo/Idh/MocA family oxidoreductase [Halieaceae bacterium]
MTLRIGIIGLGNIGTQHAESVFSGSIEGCILTAVCARGSSPIAKKFKIRHYSNYRELIDSNLCDAVLIATPTFSHFEITCYALNKGLHVLLEKPLSLSVSEGEQMLALAKPDQVFSLMLNQRTDPAFVTMKKIVSQNLLGSLQRISWTMTNWFRPDIYFHASNWRATWAGEGGGLLVNQCIHNLDILQWICGMPKLIQGFCGFGKYHEIEVEDEAMAFFEYDSGTVGTFIGSTGESPGINRFEVIGDHGMLCYDGESLFHYKNNPPTSQFSQTTQDMFSQPDVHRSNLSPFPSVNQHAVIFQNFVNAINLNDELIAPAQDGLNSLGLSNAILLSAWSGERIEMPLDSDRFDKALELRRSQSKLRKPTRIANKIDMTKSFR